MKSRTHGWVLAFVLFPLSLHAGQSTDIVGGKVVTDLREVSYIAQFIDNRGDSIRCGAVILNAWWVITAGHCLDAYYQSSLYAGTLGVGNRAPGAFELKTSKAFRHPNYRETSGSVRNDFLLIHLKKPIDLAREKIIPVTLPSPDFISRGLQNPGVLASVYGWGLMDEEEQYGSEELMKAEVPIVSDAAAKVPYPELDSTMIAAGYAAGGIDSCNGDSGGPLVVRDPQTQAPTLVGLVSFGEGCARKNYYGVYSKISAVLPWIIQTMQNNP